MIEIDTSLCCGDALCVRVCPTGCLRMRGDKAAPVPLSENLCLSCGQCLAVCPRSAITLNGFSLANVSANTTADTAMHNAIVTPESCAKLIKTRRSVRHFKDTPFDRSLLEKALEVARYAPTGKNRQDVHWIALDDKAQLSELIRLVIDAMRGVEGTQRLIAAYEKGEDPILRGAPCAIFAHAPADYDLSPADCSLAVGYLDLMLHSMGLGACWAGFAIRLAQMNPSVSSFLGVPEGRKVFAGLMVGQPAIRYPHIPQRKDAHITWL